MANAKTDLDHDDALAAEAKATRKQLAAAVNAGIKHEGKEIILPNDPYMTARQAAQVLKQKADDEEQVMNVNELVEGNPFDALVAFQAVLKETFGWATARGKTVQTFFGPIDRPAEMLDVRTGPNPEDVLQVPVGEISAPGLDFVFNVSPDVSGMRLTAKVKKYQAPTVKELAAKTRSYLLEHSIYRGKAFKQPDDWSHQPEFLSFDHVDPADLVLNSNVQKAVERFLYAQIERKAAVANLKVPSKWMAVLSGSYGTGKSFLMSILAKKALEHGRTVIYVNDTSDIADAIVVGSKRYGPILVIAEDLDRVVDNRDDEANDIINTISGVLSNRMEAMVVVSTNHPEKIDKAMIRPGRVDVFLEIPRPDAEAVEGLIHVYGRGSLAVNGRFGEVAHALAGQVASTVRAAVELAKSAAAWEGRATINEDDLLAAVTVMGPQLELLNRKDGPSEHPLLTGFRQILKDAAKSGGITAEGLTNVLQTALDEEDYDTLKTLERASHP